MCSNNLVYWPASRNQAAQLDFTVHGFLSLQVFARSSPTPASVSGTGDVAREGLGLQVSGSLHVCSFS